MVAHCCYMDLFLIDAITPFFQQHSSKKTNWSKVPFDTIHPSRDPDAKNWQAVVADMDTFCRKVAALGYNAVSIDDVAHLARSELYEPEISDAIEQHRQRYRLLIEVIKRHGLRLYLTMDVLSYTPALYQAIGTSIGPVAAFITKLLRGFLLEFSEVDGVIMRVGECDGLDVRHDFRSRLVLKRPGHVTKLLKSTLPVFEEAGREIIFRTWTVGAYRIGDLIWHRKRLAEVFNSLNSRVLTVSMKYGESDFFRYLGVNSHFFRLKLPTLVELQARREYEGCGEFPSFIGGDYTAYATALENAPNLRGISVWCQTGGWTPFCRRAFLDQSAVWNEINTAITISIFKDRLSVTAAIRRWAEQHSITDVDALQRLLERSELLIKRLLYIPDVATQKLFFRRVRVPPLLNVYWHSIFINHSLKKILTYFTPDREAAIEEGYQLLEDFEAMRAEAGACGLPVEDIDFMRDTFALLALAREYYYRPFDDEMRQRLKSARKEYKKQYPKGGRPRYKVRMNFKPFPLSQRTLKIFSAIALRRQRGYRIIDQVITLRFLSLIFRLARRRNEKLVPKFARKAAMGVDTIFR